MRYRHMHTRAQVNTPPHMHTHTRAHTTTCTPTHTYMHVHTHTHMCTHPHTHPHIRDRAHKRIHMHAHLCVHEHTATRVHTHTHTHACRRVHTCTHTHVHTHAHAPWWPGSLSQQLVGVGLPHTVVGVPRRLDLCLLSRLAAHFPVCALENLGRTHIPWCSQRHGQQRAQWRRSRKHGLRPSRCPPAEGARRTQHVETVGVNLVKLSCMCQAPILLKNMVFEGKRNKPWNIPCITPFVIMFRTRQT